MLNADRQDDRVKTRNLASAIGELAGADNPRFKPCAVPEGHETHQPPPSHRRRL